MGQVLTFKKAPDKSLLQLKQRARDIGELRCSWYDSILTCTIKVSKYATAMVREPFTSSNSITRGQFEKRCILKCINHAEQLALREIYDTEPGGAA